MQDNLTDATRWVIQQGVADGQRICIYGASYGGYAALMGAAKEPNLYRCAVGYIGVYDLPTMHTQGDVQQRVSGETYLREWLGPSATGRGIAESPACRHFARIARRFTFDHRIHRLDVCRSPCSTRYGRFAHN